MKMLYNAGLFQTILPSMKKIINQPQFDGYHRHPVDIHTLKALYYIENIQDPFVKKLYDDMPLKDQALAKLAVLFHDAGKGRSGDHHVIGENIFKKFAKGIGLDEESTQIVANIVRYHNLMSYTATTEDIYSQKIVLKFTGLLNNERSLRILYAVTYADISSVGENIYKSSTASLLRELFLQALLAFENEDLLKESARVAAKQNTIKNSKKYQELSSLQKKKIMQIHSNQIFLKLKASDIIDISVRAYDVQDFDYNLINKERLTIQIIRTVPLNLGFMLAKFSNLFNIESTNIFKLYDDKKFFEITFDQAIDPIDEPFIEDIIKDSFDMTKQIKYRQPIILKNEIDVNCDHTEELAEIKITAKDQKGLFAYIAKVLDDFDVDIESAKIHTRNGRARDLLLIQKNGNFCPNKDKIVEQLINE